MPNTRAMITRMIELIGAKEQCALYPNILTLLADASGITVITENTADAIVPESSTRNRIIFDNQKIIFNAKT